MKMNKWTVGLTALGVVSLASAVRAEEKMSAVQTTLSATTLSGYVDTSAQLNLGPGAAQNVPGYAFNNSSYANGFNLDVVGLTIEKLATEGDWAAGYKVDLWMGPYANQLNTAFSSTSDFAIKQAYVALRLPVGTGINLKMGVFDSPLGYEPTASVSNPNFTRSYGYSMEPTSFTGLLATYQVCEMVKVSGGVANTYGPTINERNTGNPSFLAWLGSISLTAPESMGCLAGSVLYGGIVNGFNSSTPANAYGGPANQTTYYVGATVNTPIKELKVGAAYDYVGVNAQALTWNNSGYANAIAGYASFQATEKMSLHGRAEYATHGGPPVVGLPTRVLGLTGTLQYDLWANVVSRLEARFDRDLNGSNSYGSYADGSVASQNAFLLAMNIIYKF
jgi:hypothetical protein